MSAQVIQLGGEAAIDTAWADYQRLARAEIYDPALILDRNHVQARILAFEKFEKLFLAGYRTAEVLKIGGGK